MRGLVFAVAVACGGCATSWGIMEGTGHPETIDEGVHESSVPVAGVREELRVTVPLAIEHAPPPAQPNGQPGVGLGPAIPFAIRCELAQHGQDTVYHAAFRYGHTWKWVAASMFVAEAATAALIYATGTDDAEHQAFAAVVAADALGTGVLALVPRKDVYRTEVRAATTVVRQDCPDGLALAIGGERFPIDAAGHLGELGDAALGDWMGSPRGGLAIELAGDRSGPDAALAIGAAEQCAWNRAHGRATPPVCAQVRYASEVAATIAVPVGAITRAL